MFFAAVSLIVNLAFAVINGAVALKYSSLWYGALAGYYIMLILLKGGVVTAKTVCGKKYGEDEFALGKSEIKTYLFSGACLVILEAAMAVAIVQMVITPKPDISGPIMAIANAAYTFYSMTMAVINIVKARRSSDYAVQAIRNVNLVSACMAMLSLTVSLIATFGEEEMLAMKASVGVVVCLLTLAIAIYMIVRASKALKSFGNANE
ncbi:MAG: hypothetical protein NC099_03105 [Corallococcus sp.]|nr:hypothetical protein [Corallococcus sp.]